MDDESQVPGEALTSQTLIKTWTVKHRGWPEGTQLVYKRGSLPAVENEFEVPANAKAGDTVTVSAVVRTPAEPGRYRAVFRLQDPSGQSFGPRLCCEYNVSQAPPQPESQVKQASSSSKPAPSAPAPTPAPTPASTPAPTPAPTPALSSAPVPGPFAVQLAALEGMGFSDTELNLQLLHGAEGDVQRVCNTLLEMIVKQ